MSTANLALDLLKSMQADMVNYLVADSNVPEYIFVNQMIGHLAVLALQLLDAAFQQCFFLARLIERPLLGFELVPRFSSGGITDGGVPVWCRRSGSARSFAVGRVRHRATKLERRAGRLSIGAAGTQTSRSKRKNRCDQQVMALLHGAGTQVHIPLALSPGLGLLTAPALSSHGS